MNPFKYFAHITQLSVFLSDCKGCGAVLSLMNEDIICGDCRAKIVMSHDPSCRVCGRIITNNADLCGECIVNPPPYRKHLSYAQYRGLLKSLILMYKYGGVERLKHLFAGIYIELLEEHVAETFDYIIPAPQDEGRKREFAHIFEISKILSKKIKTPLLPGHLVKIKKTLPQAGLSRSKRIRNLDGAFKLRRPQDIKDKKILLIDDVYTTGTTVNKCAALLKKQASDIVVLTLAHS
jgi:competence protein ComFC